LHAIAVLCACLALLAPERACADEISARPAPRTAVTIGGTSVVLIATSDKLYAFVDRIEDNAPIEDADLAIATPRGSSIALARAPITMSEATAGLFVGPLQREGHLQDTFVVNLRSAAGSGEATAEIAYDDVPAAGAAVAPVGGHESKLAVAVVSATLGAIGAVLAMLWLRGTRRRVAAAPVRSAQTV